MLRLASGMMVITLLSTSIISGTFAKYVTTATSAEDSAVVAKWGVTVAASGSLFGKNYSNKDKGNTPIASSDSTSITVASSDSSNNLVAPGTENSDGLTLSVTGTPEVSTKVSAEIDAQDIYLREGTYQVLKKETVTEKTFAAVKDGLYTLDKGVYTKVANDAQFDTDAEYYTLVGSAVTFNGDYYPVKYTLNGETGKKATEIAALIAAKFDENEEQAEDEGDDPDTTISPTGETSEVAGGTDDSDDNTITVSKEKEFKPTDDLSTLNLGSINISWKWEFSGNDEQDTLLGDIMAGNTVAYNQGGTLYNVTKKDNIIIIKPEPEAEAAAVADDGDADEEDSLGAGEATTSENEIEIGCLMTKFDITLTAEQVD